MQSLVKYLVASDAGSRRACAALVMAGRVQINGHPANSLTQQVGPKGKVTVDGRLLKPAAVEPTYLILHKPSGYLTTVRDDRHRSTVMDLVPEQDRVPGLVPVGRLDQETTGLLLLTNDGPLAYRLTHPRYQIQKEYEAVLDGPLSAGQRQRMVQGIRLTTGPARAMSVRQLTTQMRYSITLVEGQKREIRLMAKTLGRTVVKLRRVRMGSLLLGPLASGKVRRLTAAELRELKQLVDATQQEGPSRRPAPTQQPSKPPGQKRR
jgi:23S rRNA pseudouridine2605 synthase